VDATGPVAITLVNPTQGGIGAQVQLFGIGFSNIPTENTIAFNGVPAPVLAASVNSLTTQVPTGTTTGLITVTTPLGSAVSPTPFTFIGAKVTVSPTQATLVVRASQQFSATVTETADERVAWSVNGITGGNATGGTINSEGIYTAPAAVPTPPTVTIRVASVPSPGVFAEATVTIVQEATDFAEAAVSVRFGPPPPGTIGTAPISVLFGPPPPGTVVGRDVSVTNGPLITAVSPSSGIQGASNLAVTLRGVNLNGATALTFLLNRTSDGSISASGLSVTPEGTEAQATLTITATAPLGPRAVVITTPAGPSSTLELGTNIFSVLAP